jgi:lipopolysaccharide transport system permease protein
MTTVIESMRRILLGHGTISMLGIVYTLIITGMTLIAGIIIFNRVEKSFVDTI